MILSFEGIVKLATGCFGERQRVSGPYDDARSEPIRWSPLSARDHQPRGLAVFPFPTQLSHGREMPAARGILVSHEAVRQWASSSAKPLPTPSADADRSRVTNGTWMKS